MGMRPPGNPMMRPRFSAGAPPMFRPPMQMNPSPPQQMEQSKIVN